MICSQNEITAVLYKAAVGSGLTVGLAQDLAKAGAWLCATGRPGVALCLDALQPEFGPRPSIGDWCTCLDLLASGVIEVASLKAPVAVDLLEAFANLAGASYQLNYVIDAQSDGGASVSCVVGASRASVAPAMTELIQVDPADLLRAQTLAHKTYVPASDASRLSGAGAGLTDND